MAEKSAGITVYSSWIPALAEGDYSLSVKQTVAKKSGDSLWTFEPPQRQFKFGSPRYSLTSTDVLGTFPAPDSKAPSSHLLPYISFRDPYMPWERRLQPESTWKDTPWMALFLLNDKELTSGNYKTGTVDALLSRAKNKDESLILPSIKKLPPDELSVAVLDLSAAQFTHLKADPDEYNLLSHVREQTVEISGALQSHPASSQVIANRFPRSPGRYTAFVVSLSGHETSFGSQSIPSGATIRLISLYSWSFTVADVDNDDYDKAFDGIKAEIASSSGSAGRLRAAGGDAKSAVMDRLGAGYIPIPYSLGTGEKTTAWYRGPLGPVPEAPAAAHIPFASADGALIYVPDNGMFDISLASAWTLGAQLVLSRHDLLHTMLDWKGTSSRVAMNLIVASAPEMQDRPLNSLSDMTSGSPGLEQVKSLSDPQSLLKDFHAEMQSGLAERLTAALNAPYTAPPELSVADSNEVPGIAPEEPFNVSEGDRDVPPESLTDLHAHGMAFLQQPNIATLLRAVLADNLTVTNNAAALEQETGEEVSDTEMNISTGTADSEKNTDSRDAESWAWDPVALLSEIPVCYLLPVADPVLPINSVRLFYIDQKWLSAFADGMLSIGTHTELDIQLTNHIKAVVFPQKENTTAAACGLIVRSQIIRHWPQGKFSSGEKDLIFSADGANLVARKQIAADSALLLFDRIPKSIVLREPSHVLEFGLDSTGKLSERVDGKASGKTWDIWGKPGDYMRESLTPGNKPDILKVKNLPSDISKDSVTLANKLIHPPTVLTIKLPSQGE